LDHSIAQLDKLSRFLRYIDRWLVILIILYSMIRILVLFGFQILHSDKLSVLFQFLQQASALNMTTSRYSYIFTNMDLFLIEEYINTASSVFECNISGFRIVKTDPLMKTEVGLTSDAVAVVGKALTKLRSDGVHIAAETIVCEEGGVWTGGVYLNRAIRQVEMETSATGILNFNETGQRSMLVLDGIKRINSQFVKKSAWQARARKMANDLDARSNLP
uniref:ANF_receptor domain-containing protein n=1 Tax=Gongylonema pulchrum TaxID=637853 RepID=A0A183CXR4_9BILA